MIRLTDSSEQLEVYVTYVITLDDDVGDADQIRRDVENALDLMDWEPILEHFDELMYRFKGQWEYSLGHYINLEYPSNQRIRELITQFWEAHLLAHQNVVEVRIKTAHKT